MLSAPTSTAPAACRRCTSTASAVAAGMLAVDLRAGQRDFRPSMSNRFFTAYGTPASGGSASPRVRRCAVDGIGLGAARARMRLIGEGIDPAVGGRDARQAVLQQLARADARRAHGAAMQVAAPSAQRLSCVGARHPAAAKGAGGRARPARRPRASGDGRPAGAAMAAVRARCAATRWPRAASQRQRQHRGGGIRRRLSIFASSMRPPLSAALRAGRSPG